MGEHLEVMLALPLAALDKPDSSIFVGPDDVAGFVGRTVGPYDNFELVLGIIDGEQIFDLLINIFPFIVRDNDHGDDRKYGLRPMLLMPKTGDGPQKGWVANQRIDYKSDCEPEDPNHSISAVPTFLD